MQETHKIISNRKIVTLRQEKTDKYECRNITATPDKGSCYIFSTQNNCCEFLASYGVVIQSVTQSFLKAPVGGASLTYF